MRTDPSGQVLDDRYRVIERIGAGGMGSVYRGERLKLGRIVAIKFLNDDLPNEATRRRFEREAMAMAKLEHPHCGSVLDVGVHEGQPYVVMEFVSGQNLKDVLAAGPLPIPRAIDITKQVLSGLAHAHELGIIHRDIKPANIVLSQKAGMGDFVKILDFGLVRFKQDASNLTGAMVIGTPSYMAPEQVAGIAVDHRLDLYACGVMLFELLTGEKPLQGHDPVATCMQHVNVAPPRLDEKAPGRSFGALEAIVARALAKSPTDRFADAEEFARALTDAAAEAAPRPTPIPSRQEPTVALAPPSPPPTPRAAAARPPPPGASKRYALIAGGGIAVVGAVIAIVLASRSNAATASADAGVAPVRVAPAPPTEQEIEPVEDPVSDVVTRAAALTSSGRSEAALDLVLAARKSHPQDARLPYQAARLYLDKMWWADGLKQARAAIALDPAYRSDPDLIKLVLKGFNTTRSYDWTLAKFLHDDVGAAAKPYLEDAAANHPNPIVRKRVEAELRRYP